MDIDYCHNILESEGYKRLGHIDYDFNIELWWGSGLHQELSLIYLNSWVIVRGTKQYRLTSRSNSELFARELKMFDSYLFSHYDEMHLSLSAFPHISTNMAQRKISSINNRDVPDNSVSSEELATSSEELASQAEQLKENISFFKTGEEKKEA